MSNNRKIQGIFHFDCDGAVSEIIMKRFIPNIYSYSCGYSKIDAWIKKLKKNDKVIVADISLSPDQVESIREKTDQWFIIDHHQDTEEIQNNYPDHVLYASDKCGAELCVDFCEERFPETFDELYRKNGKMRVLVMLTGIYDLWKTDHELFPKAYNLNYLYWDLVHWNFVKRFANGWDGYSISEVETIKKKQEEKEILWNEAEFVDIDDKTIVCLGSPEITNDLTLRLPEKELFFAIVHQHDELSLRVRYSGETGNVGEVLDELEHMETGIGAYTHRAGGHPKAGGASFYPEADLDYIFEVCEYIFEYMKNSSDVPF